ncbi:hypothetical protein F2Q68_00014869 [Brassica cretica]|uniref:Uncharacterized protein n=1 Tax=Brassica cretica TaxID=69181 RepID=A0A8S9HJ90_BRACR|nr:hypothetical protein F2Q68_00014869 [Brassica cretica]
MADNFKQLSDDAPEPMQVDQTSERRTLRKRKEKIPKHLKRGVNEKEMDSFTKKSSQDTLGQAIQGGLLYPHVVDVLQGNQGN